MYPSRRGESLAELQARCDLVRVQGPQTSAGDTLTSEAVQFVDTWIRRIEAEHPEVKTVIVYGHAAR